MTWDQLTSYHSEKADSLCPGHPEIEHDGIELTTGPLGQGIANAVGLAMASKHLAATYNRPGHDIISNRIWCMVGDACLQEGVGCEAFSFGGHLKLNNLTVIYDNNQVTCDGSVDLTNTENVNQKMTACGWDVVDVEDGANDVEGIVAAMKQSRDPAREKPLFINVRTVIGVGSAVAGKAVAHGAPLGSQNIVDMKKAYGWDTERKFFIPEQVSKFYEPLPARGNGWVEEWQGRFHEYTKAYPNEAAELQSRIDGNLPENWKSMIPTPGSLPLDDTPTRKSNNLVMSTLFEQINSFMVGTADLTPSVNLTWPGYEIFNPPGLKPASGKVGSYRGRYVHFGIREHVMASLANGLAAYNPGTIIPVTSTFFMFYLYAAAGVRMGALQRLQVIHVATHDSIGAGEDGPTHQPVELAALMRAMPNLHYIRVADSEEVAGAWLAAIDYRHGPTMISVSRHALPQTGVTSREGVSKGAYVVKEVEVAETEAAVTLIGVGAELSFALNVSRYLAEQPHRINARVVSFPSPALFKAQDTSYQRSILKRHHGIPAVVIEPYVAFGWERWADAGINMRSFGHSLPGKYIYQHFNFTTESMGQRIVAFIHKWNRSEVGRGEWSEL